MIIRINGVELQNGGVDTNKPYTKFNITNRNQIKSYNRSKHILPSVATIPFVYAVTDSGLNNLFKDTGLDVILISIAVMLGMWTIAIALIVGAARKIKSEQWVEGQIKWLR